MRLPVLACSLLLLTTVAVDCSDNGTMEARGPRVTGRIVKLYSGSRPDPVVCSDEGFLADPANCAVFYRCVRAAHGKYTVFRYQCGPGTIYDPETTVCNHPKNTKRSECFGAPDALSEPKPNEENEIEFINSQELPSPIKINLPAYESQRLQSTSSSANTWMTPAKSSTQMIFTQATTNSPQYVTQKSTQSGDACISDGFMGDSQNCRTFYRCVANGRGGYIRYEFSCSDTTVWDDDLQTCNHPSSVKRSRCGGNDNYDAKKSTTPPRSETMPVTQSTKESSEPSVIQEQLQVNYGSKVSQLQIQINNGTNGVVQNQTQVNYGDKVNQTQKQENYGSRNKQSQKLISNGSAVSQVQAQINHGNNVIQSQTQIDHTKQVSQTQTQSYGSDDDDSSNGQDHEKETHVTQSPQSNSSNKQCTSSGFMSDPDDCRKFYRCVDNGKSGYTKFEFTCGEGTVWDQSIEGCNHAWAVKKCGQSETVTAPPSSSPASSSTTVAQTTQHPHTTPEQETTDDSDDTDTGYGNQTPEPTSSSRPSTTTTTTQVQTTNSQVSTDSQTSDKTECQSNGFMGDPQDCKKFYRCVDNGNGGYTKYEFSCGEGTVWDPEIESCNHAWAVKKCGGSSTTDNKVEMTTKAQTTAVPQETSGTESHMPQNDDEDTGYGQPEPTSSSAIPTTTTTTTTTEQSNTPTTHESNNCETSGFMGDKNDCKKFYRCVDDGKGGFTRYEFACGEGTVWDQSIEGCNHPWAVKSCGHSDNQSSEPPIDQQTSTSHSTENPDHNSSTSHETTTAKVDSGTMAPEEATSTLKPSPSKDCQQEGFYGDETDCKKFYRCVDNGNGGYTKYEFTCGEGTVWDQEIQGCNHPTSNRNCSSTQGVSSTTTTDIPSKESDEMPTESTSKPTTAPSTSQTTSSEKPQPATTKPSSGICESEGFYGEPNDCKKFYRCVDDGKGGYTKYDFICGDGTAWDQEIQGCNHETETCKRNSPAETTETQTTHKTPDSSTETEKTTESGKPTTTTEKSDSATSNNGGTCTSDGFYANPNDCKKFYRCVSDGKGGFTKYDFACGEGTMWVQEIQACDHDNDVNSCSKQSVSTQPDSTSTTTQPQISSSTTSQPHTSESSTTSTSTTTIAQPDADEYQGESPASSGGECQSEGFYGNESDCTKFYRCVDNGNGGYTKYDFTCGEGTAWDSNIQTCNHISEVQGCNGQSQTQPAMQDEMSSTSEGTTTKASGSSTESSKPSDGTTSSGTESSSQSSKPANNDKCTEEGYYGNSEDCTKFYRCVDNGNGGYTKYDFDCGEGTIWDQDITACNHPRDVNNPSCKDGADSSSSSSSTTSSSSSESKDPSSTESTSGGGSSTTESSNQGSSNCSQDNTTKKPANKNVNCTKEGYYADPDDCKKFYRCVDWDGNGERFSVYHFDCGEGTIWDPSLDTCNHEDSVYPPRDCSGQSQGENMDKENTTTTESTTTTQGESSTTEKSTTTEQTTESTTQSATSEQTTTQETTTSEQTTTQQTTTSEQTTTQQSTTSEQTTTQQSTTSEQTTTQQSTTSEQTTTQQSTTSEQTTTQQSTTSEQTTTEQPTTTQQTTTEQATEQTTTQESTTSQQTTEQTTTQESTTSQQSTTEQTTTQSNEETTTQQSTTEQSTTESNQETTTQQDQTTTTESSESTTQQNNETSSEKQCPETEDDQYLYVCPTSFRRHPKYCNLFYQCTEDDDTHEVKIATFNCPNNTIYDDGKTQCVEESKADKKCDGQIAQRRRVKRLDAEMKQPMLVSSRQKMNCPAVGHFPFDKDDECSPSFLKCNKTKSGKLRGFVYRCPDNYMYWSVSRRCEQNYKIRHCKNSANDWSGRYEIPVERKNIAS
ncbi:unnamed protein product [Plutella xylostella]|uniref:(diamondback moth) hypothetical protein n=1 Tax=Plutella xylostella TaxID=51655 RepID=A0A8S4G1M4_PLUXY|nr:unnamed protein product [Plutella xylostella]